jgi:alpha-mannosidase
LKIDEDTGIVELTDLDNRLVMKGNELVIEDESGDLYYHQGRLPMPIKTEGGQGQKYGAFKPKRFRVEQSAVRARIIFENEFYTLRWPYRLTEKYEPLLYRHKAIDACKEVIVYKDLPRVDFVTAIDNKYPYVRIRVKFDVNVERSKYSRGTQFGVTEETTIDKIHLPRDSIELFSRAPAINWVDYHDDDKGLTLINDGNPENELKTGSIYLTLLRSVSCLSVDGHSGPMIPTPNALELRKYTFRYAVYPHLGNWKTAKSYKPALEFCRPLVAIQSGGRKSGELPPSYSFLRLEPDNLVISAFKRAEASNDVILRFYETSGKRTTARIEMFRPVKGVSEVNLLEDEVKNKKQKIKKLSPNTLSMKIKPFEIKTLKLLM